MIPTLAAILAVLALLVVVPMLAYAVGPEPKRPDPPVDREQHRRKARAILRTYRRRQ